MKQKSLFRCLFLIFCLFLLASCESKRAIAHGLDEKDANEIIVVLEPRGIQAEKVQESTGGAASQVVTWKVEVAENEAVTAMTILNQLGLPRRHGQSLLNIFQNSGLVPSELQEKIKYEEGLADSIANSIRKMDGIVDADVRLSFPKEDPLNPNKASKEKVTASVYVKHTGVLDDPNSLMIQKIKRLVAGSVVGLDYDHVTVIPDRARYADESLRDLERAHQEEKEYVSIWSIIVAKESASKFRILFFSFTFSVLIILFAFIWILWKTVPLIRERGGFRSLLKFTPFAEEKTKLSKQDEGPAEKQKEEKEPQEPGEPADVEDEPERRT